MNPIFISRNQILGLVWLLSNSHFLNNLLHRMTPSQMQATMNYNVLTPYTVEGCGKIRPQGRSRPKLGLKYTVLGAAISILF